jgi:hypothetical protein
MILAVVLHDPELTIAEAAPEDPYGVLTLTQARWRVLQTTDPLLSITDT